MNLVICSGVSGADTSPLLTLAMCDAIAKSSILFGISLTRNMSPNLDRREGGRFTFSFIVSSGFHMDFFGFAAPMIATFTSHVMSIPIFLSENCWLSIISWQYVLSLSFIFSISSRQATPPLHIVTEPGFPMRVPSARLSTPPKRPAPLADFPLTKSDF